MIVSRTALIFVISLIFFSVFVANVANLINVELNYANYQDYNAKDDQNLNGTITGKMEHLIWFLQISDIHISIFHDGSRITELREFCQNTVPAIKPSVVLASGDLTDAKTSDHIGSRQYEEEWKHYDSILKECKIHQKTKWLDIRGNHDNFNVASINSKENYFLNYSVQGKTHKRSYMYQVQNGKDIYSFIAVDACLDPGPRRPFNFVGILSEDEIQRINQLATQARNSGSKYIIWFGHFPTSCILTAGHGGVRNIIGQYSEGLVYMCGHLHQLGGIVPNMYTLQQAGFLELELGDWKDNRMYRLAAIDHGILSFIDIKHGEWPVVLITNPKHILYVIPNREPIQSIRHSTHIRILAFSLTKIMNVTVKINDNDWEPCHHVKGPLYVAKWTPQMYSSGIHNIQVYVKDEMGRDKLISQPFAIDDSRMSFGILARIALMTNASVVVFFGILMLVCILPLCVFRCVHELVKARKISRPVIRNSCLRNWTQRFWYLTAVDRVFYPLVLYPVYVCFGPWSMGYIIEEHFGAIFAWGIFVRGSYLPGSFTYAYGFIQLATFQIPFTFVLAKSVEYRIRCHIDPSQKLLKLFRKCMFHAPFYLVLLVQCIFAYFFWLAYGTVAFVLGPLRTWTIIYALFMYWHTLNLPEKCIRDAMMTWSKTKQHLEDNQIAENEI